MPLSTTAKLGLGAVFFAVAGITTYAIVVPSNKTVMAEEEMLPSGYGVHTIDMREMILFNQRVCSRGGVFVMDPSKITDCERTDRRYQLIAETCLNAVNTNASQTVPGTSMAILNLQDCTDAFTAANGLPPLMSRNQTTLQVALYRAYNKYRDPQSDWREVSARLDKFNNTPKVQP